MNGFNESRSVTEEYERKYRANTLICWLRCMLSCFSHVLLFMTLRTAARQAPLSMGFSRQEYWSWLPFPTPGDLPHLGTEPMSHVSPALQADSLPLGLGVYTAGATFNSLLGN